MDEKAVGPVVGTKDLKDLILKALDIHKLNRGLTTNKMILEKDNRVEPDIKLLKAAGNHSKYNNEIGVFVIAGNEYDSMTNEDINKTFDDLLENTGVGVELFIQRTNKRRGSSYSPFVDGIPEGSIVDINGLQKSLQQAIDQFKSNRKQKE